MRLSFKVFAAVLGIMGLSMQAEALTINAPLGATPALTCPLSPVCLAAIGNQTSQSQIDTAILPVTGGAVEVYKQNVGAAADTGAAAPFYSTQFFNSASDPSDALITWNGPSFFTTGPLYLLVKDGNQSPAWYLFTLTVGAGGWNGKENIDLQDFWPNQGAISHVSIYGAAPTTQVPDGGSMTMLLGMGLMGLAALRRML